MILEVSKKVGFNIDKQLFEPLEFKELASPSAKNFAAIDIAAGPRPESLTTTMLKEAVEKIEFLPTPKFDLTAAAFEPGIGKTAPTKLNGHLKAIIVEALRSGEYKQTFGKWRMLDERQSFYDTIMAPRVVAWCASGLMFHLVGWNGGLNYDENIYRDRLGLRNSEIQAIIGLNDRGTSFTNIADYIEATH